MISSKFCTPKVVESKKKKKKKKLVVNLIFSNSGLRNKLLTTRKPIFFSYGEISDLILISIWLQTIPVAFNVTKSMYNKGTKKHVNKETFLRVKRSLSKSWLCK